MSMMSKREDRDREHIKGYMPDFFTLLAAPLSPTCPPAVSPLASVPPTQFWVVFEVKSPRGTLEATLAGKKREGKRYAKLYKERRYTKLYIYFISLLLLFYSYLLSRSAPTSVSLTKFGLLFAYFYPPAKRRG
jgi:hypothetical protein